MERHFPYYNRPILKISKFVNRTNSSMKMKLFIFDSALVWRMQLWFLKFKIVLCVGNFNLKCLFIEFDTPNLNLIYICILEIFQTNIWNRFLKYKITFWISITLWIHKGYCIMYSQKMFVLKLSGIQNPFYDIIWSQ